MDKESIVAIKGNNFTIDLMRHMHNQGEIPLKAHRLMLDIEGHTADDIIEILEHYIMRVNEASLSTGLTMTSGFTSWGSHEYKVTDTTPEEYQAKLDDFIEKMKSYQCAGS